MWAGGAPRQSCVLEGLKPRPGPQTLGLILKTQNPDHHQPQEPSTLDLKGGLASSSDQRSHASWKFFEQSTDQ